MNVVNIPFPKWVYDLAKNLAQQIEASSHYIDPLDIWTLLPQDVQTAGRVLSHYELLRLTQDTPVQQAASPDPTAPAADEPITEVLPLFQAPQAAVSATDDAPQMTPAQGVGQ